MGIYRTTGEVICPNCGDTIVEDDWFDTEVDASNIIRRCVGTCNHCENTYIWEEVYEYVGSQNISKR